MKNQELIAFTVETHMPGIGGWGNGYVAIPEGHSCFGMDYDAIHDKYEIDVNGGLTFARYKHGKRPDITGMWIVGFDTLHYGDTMERWPDEASVMREAIRLKEQLEKIK